MHPTSSTRGHNVLAIVGLFLMTVALAACRKNAGTLTGASGPADDTIAVLAGRWRIVGYDGAPVNPSAPPGTDPKRPAMYMAGSSIDFMRDRFRLNRGRATVLDRPINLLARRGPSEIGIDIGYGESKVDLLGAGRARLHLATLPAHVVLIERVR